MVLEGGVYQSTIVVYAALLFLISEDALLLPERHPFWDGFFLPGSRRPMKVVAAMQPHFLGQITSQRKPFFLPQRVWF